MTSYIQDANISDAVERKVEKVLVQGKTAFQEYIFFESKVHGTCISLDGDIQSCESDEAMYHEALVHPAMLSFDKPKTVLIMGGGEGATAREVLKHKSVEKVVMVDIDEEFVNLCKQYVPTWGKEAFEDERLEVLYEDINVYLKNCTDKFDVVIGDLIDVSDWDSPSAFLYGADLYKRLKTHLNPNAIVVTQGGALDASVPINHNRIRKSLKEVFYEISSYGVIVPSFYHLWSFIMASDNLDALKDRQELFTQRARSLQLEALGISSLISSFNLPLKIQKNIGI